jgi:NADH:ubiquinone oxidoreductase subunit 5 (subunit L)/multisubunit Na+/H+ antiporter MnhA subunit
MEAPVPASSLIHSATLVSAGIFLLLKFQTLLVCSGLMDLIFFLGSLTACFGGVIAASQSDMKKLLAYSTISHCGFIVASISLNNFIITVIYLYLHGLFKALTFFCAGSIIKHNGTQDMRLMGMAKDQVLNTTMLIIASINLGGLPFTFGYLYKQMFLLYLSTSHFNILSYGFNIVGMLCSVVYVFKLIYYSCFDFRKGFLQTVTLYLQNYNKPAKSSFLNFTFIKFFAFLVIYVFAMLFFFITKYFILKNYIYFFHLPETVVSDYVYLNNYFFLKKQLITLFYVFFIIVVLTLITVN